MVRLLVFILRVNPRDIRDPITLVLLQEDYRFEKSFSLDLSDDETAAYMKDFVRENPRRLHEMVARSPLAATRCFHWTVRLVLRTLFNCADKPGMSADSVAGDACPGIFGTVRAYFGVVEPQMRKALHVHMLVYLLGFSHPQDLFGSSDLLTQTFRRLWYFVASFCSGVPRLLRTTRESLRLWRLCRQCRYYLSRKSNEV